MITSKNKTNYALVSSAFLWQHPAHFLALGLGSGLIKLAPGTFGSVMGILLYWAILPLSVSLKLTLIGALFLVGIPICDKAGKALGVSDHSSIVWDEIVAMMLVLTFTPNQAIWWVIAFILFRLFDIFKPFPIRQIEQRIDGGFGVMLDDLLAAIYSLIVMYLLQYFALN